MQHYRNPHNLSFSQMRKLLENIRNLFSVDEFNDRKSIESYILHHCIKPKSKSSTEPLVVTSAANPLDLFLEIHLDTLQSSLYFRVDFSDFTDKDTQFRIVNHVVRAAVNHGIANGSEQVKSGIKKLLGIA